MKRTDTYRKQLGSLYGQLRTADKYERQDIEEQMRWLRAKLTEAGRTPCFAQDW